MVTDVVKNGFCRPDRRKSRRPARPPVARRRRQGRFLRHSIRPHASMAGSHCRSDRWKVNASCSSSASWVSDRSPKPSPTESRRNGGQLAAACFVSNGADTLIAGSLDCDGADTRFDGDAGGGQAGQIVEAFDESSSAGHHCPAAPRTFPDNGAVSRTAATGRRRLSGTGMPRGRERARFRGRPAVSRSDRLIFESDLGAAKGEDAWHVPTR